MNQHYKLKSWTKLTRSVDLADFYSLEARN